MDKMIGINDNLISEKTWIIMIIAWYTNLAMGPLWEDHLVLIRSNNNKIKFKVKNLCYSKIAIISLNNKLVNTLSKLIVMMKIH
jgi:hypothetical protein